MNELEIAYKEFEVGLMKESNITKTIIDKAIIMLEGGDDSVIYEASTDGLLTRLKERFKKMIRSVSEELNHLTYISSLTSYLGQKYLFN